MIYESRRRHIHLSRSLLHQPRFPARKYNIPRSTPVVVVLALQQHQWVVLCVLLCDNSSYVEGPWSDEVNATNVAIACRSSSLTRTRSPAQRALQCRVV